MYVLQGKPVLTEIRFSGNSKYGNETVRRFPEGGEPLNEQKPSTTPRKPQALPEGGLQRPRSIPARASTGARQGHRPEIIEAK
jgi:hypothetical protein